MLTRRRKTPGPSRGILVVRDPELLSRLLMGGLDEQVGPEASVEPPGSSAPRVIPDTCATACPAAPAAGTQASGGVADER